MRRATSPMSLPKTAPIIRFVTYKPSGTGRGIDAAVRKNYKININNHKNVFYFIYL